MPVAFKIAATDVAHCYNLSFYFKKTEFNTHGTESKEIS
ncbi:hypothetical protein BH11BAC5_BH11BAC5_51770 [soil metagenome]